MKPEYPSMPPTEFTHAQVVKSDEAVWIACDTGCSCRGDGGKEHFVLRLLDL